MYHPTLSSLFSAISVALAATLSMTVPVLFAWAIVPDRLRRYLRLSDIDLFFAGYGAIAVACWYAFLCGFGARCVFMMAIAAFCAGMMLRILRHRLVAHTEDPGRLFGDFSWDIAVIFALALLVALQWTPYITSATLNFASSGNNDIYAWTRIGDFLLGFTRGDAGNILNCSLAGIPHDCFAAFLYLSYWSFVLHERAIECAVPGMAQASVLFGFIVYRTMREIYRLDRPVSALVAAAILANPFWIYILQNYFLSQVISTAWLLAFFLRCCKEHETGRRWGLATTIVFTIYFIMGILLCPIKYIVDVAVVGAFAAILLIWDYRQELFRLRIRGDFLRAGAWRAAALTAALLLSVANVPGQYVWLVSRFTAVTNADPGWPLKTINPLLLAGVFNFDWNLDKSQAVTMAVLYLVIIGAGPLMLAFSHWRKRKISAPLGAFTLMWLLLLIAYLGVHGLLGSRYIAWKFAGYYPLMISFALPALAIYIVQSEGPRWIRKALPVFLVIMVAAGMLSLRHTKMETFSAGYRSLAVIDELPVVQALNLEAAPYGETMLATEFIEHKILNPISVSYYPPGEVLDVIAGQKAAFLTHESSDNGLNAPDIPLGAGFNLYLTKPAYVVGKPIRFNVNLQMKLSGVSAAEPWGRWTDGKQARLELPLHDAPASDVDLTLYFHAFTPAAKTQHVTLRVNGVSYGSKIFADGNDTEWTVRIPRARMAAKKLTVELDLPDAVPPSAVSSSTDTRLLGIGLTKMLLECKPKDL